jgi:hypothetical protein
LGSACQSAVFLGLVLQLAAPQASVQVREIALEEIKFPAVF